MAKKDNKAKISDLKVRLREKRVELNKIHKEMEQVTKIETRLIGKLDKIEDQVHALESKIEGLACAYADQQTKAL